MNEQVAVPEYLVHSCAVGDALGTRCKAERAGGLIFVPLRANKWRKRVEVRHGGMWYGGKTEGESATQDMKETELVSIIRVNFPRCYEGLNHALSVEAF